MEPNEAVTGGEERPRWEVPAAVNVAPGIDLQAQDPALDGSRRRCVALSAAGARCRSNAITDLLLCSAHAGRLDSAAGGRAKAQKLSLVREERENRIAEARMGARAVVAARLIERASDVRLALDKVIDDAKAGNTAQAKTLLGYLVAAFPDVAPSGNSPGSDEAEALTSMSTSQLRALALPQD